MFNITIKQLHDLISKTNIHRSYPIINYIKLRLKIKDYIIPINIMIKNINILAPLCQNTMASICNSITWILHQVS